MENISYTTAQNPDELVKAFKQFQDIPVTLVKDNSVTIKCPFQSTNNGEFHNCYLSRCMAFRCDDKNFWCARLESESKNRTAKYPSIKNLKDNNNGSN